MFAQYQMCNKSSQKYQRLFWTPEIRLYFFILPRKEYSEWKARLYIKQTFQKGMLRLPKKKSGKKNKNGEK